MTSRIILATDELTLEQCLALAPKVGDRVHAFKIHNHYDEHGPEVVKKLRDAGVARVWVDFKIHDIPNTARKRAAALFKAGADILTVHAAGGVEMIEAAVKEASSRSGVPGQIFAITALTSLNEAQITRLHGASLMEAVLFLAEQAKEGGAHGVVCSPKEVGDLNRRLHLKGLKWVIPGVRSSGQAAGDQKRVGTPAQAIVDGANYLVIGRQITQADDPITALTELEQEIASVTGTSTTAKQGAE